MGRSSRGVTILPRVPILDSWASWCTRCATRAIGRVLDAHVSNPSVNDLRLEDLSLARLKPPAQVFTVAGTTDETLGRGCRAHRRRSRPPRSSDRTAVPRTTARPAPGPTR